MGRTVHYRTRQAVSSEELKALERIVEKYNNEFEWGRERLKLWSSAGGPFPRGVAWGFTKVADDAEGKLVLRAVKEMSKTTPRLTWLVYDEGGLTNGKELVLKRGNVVDARLPGGFHMSFASKKFLYKK
jgi:hypothetical protein